MLEYYLIFVGGASVGFLLGGFMASAKVADVERRLARQEALMHAQADLICHLAETMKFFADTNDPKGSMLARGSIEKCHVVLRLMDGCLGPR